MNQVAAPNSASETEGLAVAGGLHVNRPKGSKFQVRDKSVRRE